MTTTTTPTTRSFGLSDQEHRPQQSRNLLQNYLKQIDPNRISDKGWRQAVCMTDPMMFALIYLPHHLKNEGGAITISEVHVDWANEGKKWLANSKAFAGTGAGTDAPTRDAYIAPRNMGKSTWFFLILPMWAAAFGHRKFAAAFADSGTQAEIHLTTFKNELDNNRLIRTDFPNLASPARRENSGQTVADNRAMIVMKNGFTFAARGIDASNLGLKVNENRPDLIIFDDVEPPESNYSPYQAGQRLGTIIEAILPMNLGATVIFVGTVVMAGSIIHQLVESVETAKVPEPWIVEESINVHYYAPIKVLEDGTETSVWPEKWSLKYLNSIRRTRTYAKNFLNKPTSKSGAYWTEEDFTYNQNVTGITTTILSIDPAVTKKKSSDFTGIANLAFRPGFRPAKGSIVPARLPKVIVQDIQQVKLTGEKLRQHVLRMIANSPTPVQSILIEVNQGGDTWYSVFHNMPVKVLVVTNSVGKEVRAANLLGHYQRGHVEHLREFPELEEQMINYPDVLHDDMIDAVGTGVRYFAKKRRKPKQIGVSNVAYI